MSSRWSTVAFILATRAAPHVRDTAVSAQASDGSFAALAHFFALHAIVIGSVAGALTIVTCAIALFEKAVQYRRYLAHAAIAGALICIGGAATASHYGLSAETPPTGSHSAETSDSSVVGGDTAIPPVSRAGARQNKNRRGSVGSVLVHAGPPSNELVDAPGGDEPTPSSAPSAEVPSRQAVPASAVSVPAVATNAHVELRLTRDACESDLKPQHTLLATLTTPLALVGGGAIPAGTAATILVDERRVASGDQPTNVTLELQSIHGPSGDVAVESSSMRIALERPSMTGAVVKGAAIGAVGGAVIALVLRKNAVAGAAIGGAIGGAAGAAHASGDEACIAAAATTLPFSISTGGAR